MHNRALDEIELPPDVQAALDEAFPKGEHRGSALSREKLLAFSEVMKKKRDEAVSFRQASGIEEIWARCEDNYVGIDDANRNEYANARWIKPTSMEGPVTTSSQAKGQKARSTVFIRLTARYVDAGSAKLGEILLPADDKAFSLTHTPVPELAKYKDNLGRVMINGIPAERDATAEEVQALRGGPPAAPAQAAPAGQAIPAAPLTVKDLIKEYEERAAEKAKRAETRIYDWMVECQYTAKARNVIFDAARIGVGVLKGPYPEYSKAMSLSSGVETMPQAQPNAPAMGAGEKPRLTLQILEEIKPSVKWIDPWNFYPDPSCGENIHNGDHCFEKDRISRKQLRALKKQKGYLAEQIDLVLKEGPSPTKTAESRNPTNRDVPTGDDRFEIWYCHGTITRDELQMLNADIAKDVAEDKEDVFAIVTMVNDHVIYATLNPLDSGALPYNTVPWQRRVGSWTGVGIGEQLFVPQRMINAATRALLNNAGMSAGSQIVVDRGAIEPADNSWELTPDKIWGSKRDAAIDDVRKAFYAFEIPNRTEPLMNIIEYAFRLAEESTNIPLISQGQSGPTTPDTFGAAQLQNNNANQLLRNVGYTFDDYVTEPLVRKFYEWLLLDPDVPDDEKGDFKINAHGSIALVERAIQDQTILQMAPLALNPAYGIDPKRWFAQLSKSKRMNPSDFQYTEEEQRRIDETPPPPPPQVQVAQLKIQADAQQAELDRQLERELAQLEYQYMIARAKMDTDRDTAYVQAETERTQAEGRAKLQELLVKKELAILDYSNKRGISVEQAKAAIAQTAMKLRVQKELAMLHQAAKAPQVASPPTEPPGRAPAGQAYQK